MPSLRHRLAASRRARPTRSTVALPPRRQPQWSLRQQPRRPHQDGRPDWKQTATTLASILSVLLVAAGLFYTNEANRKQQELAERGQVTDRFTRAIEQLGSDKLDVRLGGIYALERLMRDSPGDRRNLVEVLSAYVRGHSPRTPAAPKNGAVPSPGVIDPVHPPRPATDVQAALTVLGHRPAVEGSQMIDLSGIDLTGADLSRANLIGANLAETRLAYADLDRANLEGAYLVSTQFRHAVLIDANLHMANLAQANLSEAELHQANVSVTNLTYADISRAVLERATFRDALLENADLRHAALADADLTGAKLPGAKLSDADLNGTILRGTSLVLTDGLTSGLVRCTTPDDRTAWPPGVVGPVPGELHPECLPTQ
ncbi:pentapeptide repeat-containing protein [Micromonospora sp. NPDC047740]|uniref:pentapeptide repeat-containing protein n=1 Tax=Micromonospora sp. NPDC047740 TaxID=3364254 RepID=UPI00371EED6E